jgi:hypothetical protein
MHIALADGEGGENCGSNLVWIIEDIEPCERSQYFHGTIETFWECNSGTNGYCVEGYGIMRYECDGTGVGSPPSTVHCYIIT